MIIPCTGQGLEVDTNKIEFCVLISCIHIQTFINNTKQLVKPFDYTLLEPWLQTGLLTR